MKKQILKIAIILFSFNVFAADMFGQVDAVDPMDPANLTGSFQPEDLLELANEAAQYSPDLVVDLDKVPQKIDLSNSKVSHSEQLDPVATQQAIDQAIVETGKAHLTPNSLYLEGFIGKCWNKHQPNGVWFQEPFLHQWTTSSLCGGLGIKVVAGNKIVIHFGFENFGHAEVDSWDTASDANYAVCRFNTKQCLPLSHFMGKGGNSGFYMTVDAYSGKILGIATTIQLGVVAERSRWAEHVTPYILSTTCTPGGSNTPCNPGNVSVNSDSKPQIKVLVVADFQITNSTSLQLRYFNAGTRKGDLYYSFLSGRSVSVVISGFTSPVYSKPDSGWFKHSEN